MVNFKEKNLYSYFSVQNVDDTLLTYARLASIDKFAISLNDYFM